MRKGFKLPRGDMRSSDGVTLIELMVYSLLLLVVFSALLATFVLGKRYFEMSRTAAEVQQSLAVVGHRLTWELSESDPMSIEMFPNSNSNAPVGVVFLSARDDNGVFVLDATQGTPIWQKCVGYYLDSDPEFPDSEVMALYRAEYKPSGLPTTDSVTPSSLGVTTQTLRQNGVKKRLIAHGFLAPSNARPHGGFDVYWMNGSNKNYDQGQGAVYVDLEVINKTTGVAVSGNQADARSGISSQFRVDLRN